MKFKFKDELTKTKYLTLEQASQLPAGTLLEGWFSTVRPDSNTHFCIVSRDHHIFTLRELVYIDNPLFSFRKIEVGQMFILEQD